MRLVDYLERKIGVVFSAMILTFAAGLILFLPLELLNSSMCNYLPHVIGSSLGSGIGVFLGKLATD